MAAKKWHVGDDESAASIMLDDKHELLVTRTDEGVVLDVWDKSRSDQDGPVYSNYIYDGEMLPDEDEP